MIIEVDGYQIQRKNVTRHIVSNNIKSLYFCDNIDQGTK